MCGMSRIAADRYLNDQTDLADAVNVFKGYVGDRSAYAGFVYSPNAYTWMCDPSQPRGLNPVGCSKDGHDLSGAPVEDVQRGGAYTWPPPSSNLYPWGGFSAAVAQAEMLFRLGYPAYEWESQGIRRGLHWLQTAMSDGEAYPNYWQVWIVNRHYPDFTGQPFPAHARTGYGRGLDWTFWTHQ